MGQKVGDCPFGGLGPCLTECGLAEAYLHTKFCLHPSNRLATIHRRHRQTDRHRRRTGQTTVR